MPRETVLYASDAACQPDWPQWLRRESEMAQQQHIIYRGLEDLAAACRTEDAPADASHFEELARDAFNLWQRLERVLSDSLRVWNTLSGPVRVSETPDRAATLAVAMDDVGEDFERSEREAEGVDPAEPVKRMLLDDLHDEDFARENTTRIY